MTVLDKILRWMTHGRYNTTLPTYVNGDVGEVQIDSRGRLRVATTPETAADVSSVHRSTGLGSSGLIRSTAGQLVAIYASNVNAAQRYFQIFNITSAPPTNAAVPFQMFPIAPNGILSFEPKEPEIYTAGIVWAISTTPGTLTLSGTADAWVTALHRA